MRSALFLALVVALGAGVPATDARSQAALSLIGVWKVAEIVSPQAETNREPQPTMYIFTARHYSHVSVTSATARPNYTWPNVTDAQRLEMWQPFSATAGTYVVSGNQLTLHPLVAKNPGFMDGRSFMSFAITRDGNDIWMQAVQSQARSIASAESNRVRLIRVE